MQVFKDLDQPLRCLSGPVVVGLKKSGIVFLPINKGMEASVHCWYKLQHKISLGLSYCADVSLPVAPGITTLLLNCGIFFPTQPKYPHKEPQMEFTCMSRTEQKPHIDAHP